MKNFVIILILFTIGLLTLASCTKVDNVLYRDFGSKLEQNKGYLILQTSSSTCKMCLAQEKVIRNYIDNSELPISYIVINMDDLRNLSFQSPPYLFSQNALLVLFKDNKEQARLLGATDEYEIANFFDRLIHGVSTESSTLTVADGEGTEVSELKALEKLKESAVQYTKKSNTSVVLPDKLSGSSSDNILFSPATSNPTATTPPAANNPAKK